jgi:hypothetical protein
MLSKHNGTPIDKNTLFYIGQCNNNPVVEIGDFFPFIDCLSNDEKPQFVWVSHLDHNLVFCMQIGINIFNNFPTQICSNYLAYSKWINLPFVAHLKFFMEQLFINED